MVVHSKVKDGRKILRDNYKNIRGQRVTLSNIPRRGDPMGGMLVDKKRKGDRTDTRMNQIYPNSRKNHFDKSGKNCIPA